MSEVTGTLIASVIAFVAAVIGAVIAGRYAKRGAEAGGRKAVEAALAQVQGQAAVEHWQWVRSQRHQSIAAFFAAYAALDDVLAGFVPEVRNGGSLNEVARRELHEGMRELQAKTSQLALWGPREAIDLAYGVTGKSLATMGALLQAQSTASASLNTRWSAFDRVREEMVLAHAAFLERAGEIVRDPRQPIS
ncbi:hypothetical protein HLK59_45080 [Streptomyces sp. S3(2020)]|uniref:hypothetical protein n=1 Tax=Streptomyces sp. S3(2020) TaxID=2732044 RepID=UPI001488683F|nr:hypothetical protein [Streptomyces sp. S3(2020)]NNN37390.1 hypothetical protein [Streptomyces sp. S3(2020)]